MVLGEKEWQREVREAAPYCPPLRRGGRSPVPPVPAVAGDRAVAIHWAVVLIEGWVLQARLQAFHSSRGLCHSKERQRRCPSVSEWPDARWVICGWGEGAVLVDQGVCRPQPWRV